MPDITVSTNRYTDWNEWLAHAEEIPCAAYAMKNDDKLSLLGGNQAFYRLFGYSEEELRQRYGGRLSALVDAEPLKALPSSARETMESFEVKQHLSRNGSDAWLLTKLMVYPLENDTVFCCVSMDITESESILKKLISFEDTVRIAAEQANLDYMEYNYETGAADVRSALSLLPSMSNSPDGTCPDFVEQMISGGIICPGYETTLQKAFHYPNGTEKKATYEFQIHHKDRGILWVKLSIAVKDGDNQAVCLWEDITQEKEAARNYLNETQFYQSILSEKDAYGHVDVTENRVTRVGGMWNLYNEIINTITYAQLIEEYIYKVVHPEDRKQYLEVMQPDNFIQSFHNGIDQLGCEFRRIVEQNKMVWMQLSVYLFQDPLTNHILALMTIKNINDRKQQEMLLLYDSRIDQLTNVYNRRMTQVLICEYLSEVTSDDWYAFIVLDVDNFKQINDLQGHHMGDQVLNQLADYLSHFFRSNDIVGRFGGDEFIVFLTNLADKDCVEARMQQFYEQLKEDRLGFSISCSSGIAICQGPQPYEQLFRQADQALYCAKKAGKGQFCFYTGEIIAVDNRRLAISKQPAIPDNISSLSYPSSIDYLELTSAESRSFDSFVASYGDIAYLINPDNFDLICGNQAFYDRLGMSVTQCHGMKCYEAMQRRSTPCPFCSRANWSTDKFYLWRNRNTALEQEFLIKNKLVMWQGKEALLALAIDISNDKSIVDSMNNNVTETHHILSGVQHMTEAPTLTDAIQSALETIGNFFYADAVCFWQYTNADNKYSCTCHWTRNKSIDSRIDSSHAITQWLEHNIWEHSIILESPEAMLGYSYDMYLHMKKYGIRNQRWMQLKEGPEILGFLDIDNTTSNYLNIAFLESFAVFLAGELKKRGLIESALYSGLHDDLTGLLSRKSFEEYMGNYSPDQVCCVGVIMANFNNLKGINSSRGFQTGNYFIRQFSEILQNTCKDSLIFRLNGDEFLVITLELSRFKLEDYIIALQQQIHDNGKFSVSIGSSWDDVEKDLPTLIEQATQAMKVHKKRHYDTLPVTLNDERRKMLKDLVSSIENREFEVFLQPKVELLHGSVVGAEALIRYRSKDSGYIQPAQFIDILEKNNLIRYIDLFVFEEICKQLEKWRHQGLFLPVISINFSRLTLLEQDILTTMETIVSRYNIPRKYLEIEITESISNIGKSILYQTVQDLYQAGFAISLDDFGTKYTNLSILADLDINILKVDKSLIGDLGGHVNHQKIMKNIISMCQDLGITVLAEGIETKDQESILQTLDCSLGQGYLYGKPMPINEFDQTYIQINQLQ